MLGPGRHRRFQARLASRLLQELEDDVASEGRCWDPAQVRVGFEFLGSCCSEPDIELSAYHSRVTSTLAPLRSKLLSSSLGQCGGRIAQW